MGIPILVNLSWFLTLIFVTSMLALNVYPNAAFDDEFAATTTTACCTGSWRSPAASSSSARSCCTSWRTASWRCRQGIPVKSITLFIFGGVSADRRRGAAAAARVRHGDRRAADQPAAWLASSWSPGGSPASPTSQPVAIVARVAVRDEPGPGRLQHGARLPHGRRPRPALDRLGHQRQPLRAPPASRRWSAAASATR